MWNPLAGLLFEACLFPVYRYGMDYSCWVYMFTASGRLGNARPLQIVYFSRSRMSDKRVKLLRYQLQWGFKVKSIFELRPCSKILTIEAWYQWYPINIICIFFGNILNITLWTVALWFPMSLRILSAIGSITCYLINIKHLLVPCLLSAGHSETNCCAIWIRVPAFLVKNIITKISSSKWGSFCFGDNLLNGAYGHRHPTHRNKN